MSQPPTATRWATGRWGARRMRGTGLGRHPLCPIRHDALLLAAREEHEGGGKRGAADIERGAHLSTFSCDIGYSDSPVACSAWVRSR
jgi:hypothetical protein